jgi:hypothetical protein
MTSLVPSARRSVRCRYGFALLSPWLLGCENAAQLLGIVVTEAGAPPVVVAEGSAADAQAENPPDAGTGQAPNPPDAGPDVDATDAGSSCDLSSPFGAPVLLAGLQSTTSEGGFRLMLDELSGFFWSERAGGPGSTNLYATSRPDAGVPFGDVRLLANVNMPDSLTIDPTATANGLTLVFRARMGPVDSGIDKLYSATRPDAAGDFPAGTLMASLNSTSDTVQPFLLPDGSEIYFSSSRLGDFDIFRATQGSSAFDTPSAVAELNVTGANEGDPVLSVDDLTIFFSSTRDGGVGMQDIWEAQRPSKAASFGAPVNVREVNSTGTDAPTWLSPDGCRLYMSSDRDGAIHLYLASRP